MSRKGKKGNGARPLLPKKSLRAEQAVGRVRFPLSPPQSETVWPTEMILYPVSDFA